MRKPTYTAFLAIIAVLAGGCVSSGEDNVRRLINHPGFEEAHRAAPGFTIEALQTVEQLQRERDAALRFR